MLDDDRLVSDHVPADGHFGTLEDGDGSVVADLTEVQADEVLPTQEDGPSEELDGILDLRVALN